MRGYLDACYTLVVDEFAEQGVARSKLIETLNASLDEPLPDELTPEQAEMRRRRRIAEENRASTDKLAAMSGMLSRGEE